MIHPGIKVRIDTEARVAYVTISESEAYPSFEDVFEALLENRIAYPIDEEAVNGALGRRLTGQEIAAAKARDGGAEISVEPDMMTAHMRIHPAHGGNEATVADIRQMLVKEGIVQGVDYEAIEKAIEDHVFEQPVLIASGKRPVEGRDARVEYLFPMEMKIHPKEIEYDMVDFRELQAVISVDKDEILAAKTAAVQGQSGIMITGKPVAVKTAKDVRLVAGKGTRLSEDGLQVFSTIAGQPVLKEKTVTVEPVLRIQGDVNYDTGNINFAGSIIISGGITSGFSVEAGENIEIDGVVEDCHITAGKDVLIKGGVQGRSKGIIKAGGSVSALFVQYGSIEAGGDVVTGEALHSNLSAGGSILVSAGRGRILGGNANARNLIEAKVVGSETYVRTELRVGFKPQEKRRLEDKKKEKAAREASLLEIEKGMKVLEQRKKEGDLPEAKAALYMRLIAASEELFLMVDQLTEEIALLEEGLEKAVKPEIKVSKIIYPNVGVVIGTLPFETKADITFSILREEEGRIKTLPYTG